MASHVPLEFWAAVFWATLGMLVNILWPTVNLVLQEYKSSKNLLHRKSFAEKIKEIWLNKKLNEYARLFTLSLFFMVVILFLFDLKFFSAREAFLSGFAWEAFAEKTGIARL